jgi:hypothetical protein
VVETPRLIDEHCPGDTGLLDIGARERTGLERDDDDIGVEIAQGLRVLLQLQQMPSARQSTKVPMKHQQQPMALVVLETMGASLDVRERERGGGMTDLVFANDTRHVSLSSHRICGYALCNVAAGIPAR